MIIGLEFENCDQCGQKYFIHSLAFHNMDTYKNEGLMKPSKHPHKKECAMEIKVGCTNYKCYPKQNTDYITIRRDGLGGNYLYFNSEKLKPLK